MALMNRMDMMNIPRMSTDPEFLSRLFFDDATYERFQPAENAVAMINWSEAKEYEVVWQIVVAYRRNEFEDMRFLTTTNIFLPSIRGVIREAYIEGYKRWAERNRIVLLDSDIIEVPLPISDGPPDDERMCDHALEAVHRKRRRVPGFKRNYNALCRVTSKTRNQIRDRKYSSPAQESEETTFELIVVNGDIRIILLDFSVDLPKNCQLFIYCQRLLNDNVYQDHMDAAESICKTFDVTDTRDRIVMLRILVAFRKFDFVQLRVLITYNNFAYPNLDAMRELYARSFRQFANNHNTVERKSYVSNIEFPASIAERHRTTVVALPPTEPEMIQIPTVFKKVPTAQNNKVSVVEEEISDFVQQLRTLNAKKARRTIRNKPQNRTCASWTERAKVRAVDLVNQPRTIEPATRRRGRSIHQEVEQFEPVQAHDDHDYTTIRTVGPWPRPERVELDTTLFEDQENIDPAELEKERRVDNICNDDLERQSYSMPVEVENVHVEDALEEMMPEEEEEDGEDEAAEQHLEQPFEQEEPEHEVAQHVEDEQELAKLPEKRNIIVPLAKTDEYREWLGEWLEEGAAFDPLSYAHVGMPVKPEPGDDGQPVPQESPMCRVMRAFLDTIPDEPLAKKARTDIAENESLEMGHEVKQEVEDDEYDQQR